MGLGEGRTQWDNEVLMVDEGGETEWQTEVAPGLGRPGEGGVREGNPKDVDLHGTM